MGYSHYWKRRPNLSPIGFRKASEDIALMIETLKQRGIQISGPTGYGRPDVSDMSIAFNGTYECGHRYADYGDPWPSQTAEGVEASLEPISEGESWFSGPRLETRVCGGCCAKGAFVVDRNYLARRWEQPEGGRYFSKCETAFKPYDLLVTAALIRLKERLGDEILVSSDGFERGFEDGKRLCRELFGWPTRFELEAHEKDEDPLPSPLVS